MVVAQGEWSGCEVLEAEIRGGADGGCRVTGGSDR